MTAREKAKMFLLGGVLGLVMTASVWLSMLTAGDLCVYVSPPGDGYGVNIREGLPQ
jgi:hypothetical protein